MESKQKQTQENNFFFLNSNLEVLIKNSPGSDKETGKKNFPQ